MSNVSRRKVLAGAGAAGAVALGLAACGNDSSGGSGGVPNSTQGPDVSKNKDGAMDKYGVGDQFKATKPLKFSIMMLSNAAYPYNANWLFFQELTKRTNVSFDPSMKSEMRKTTPRFFETFVRKRAAVESSVRVRRGFAKSSARMSRRR